jgi:acetyl esterase/lipase
VAELEAKAGEITLWPGIAPGSEDWEQVESENHDLLPHRIIRNVVHPTLTPYLAAPENNTGVAVIVAPGGGFKFLSIDTEGTQVAQWLRDRGINAFVLKYRLDETAANNTLFKVQVGWFFLWVSLNGVDDPDIPLSPVQALAIEDALAAIRHVRENNAAWRLREDSIGILGFSAGGAVATGAGMTGEGASRPDFVASIYGVPDTAGVPVNAPPLLVVATEDDPLVPVSLGEGLHSSWLEAGFSSELVIYPDGGHGFGMQKKNASSDQWIEDFYRWLLPVTSTGGGEGA